jgi:hypothetical protein
LEFENNIIKVCPDRVRGDCGLKDILVDSSVYAAGTVDQMMCGKQFNRVVRALILVYEALRSLWLSAFVQWCEDNGIVNPLPDPVRTDLYNIVFSRLALRQQLERKILQKTLVYNQKWRNCNQSKRGYTDNQMHQF